MDDILNAAAHIAMILLTLYILVFMVAPALAIGIGGLLGLKFLRKKMPEWLGRVTPTARQGLTLIDRGCALAVWPAVTVTSFWRGTKATLSALRRQAASE